MKPEVTTLRLSVDMIACEGRGLCAEVLPELIELDDWGYPIITGHVPHDLEEHAREAVRLCPRLALRLSASAMRSSRNGSHVMRCWLALGWALGIYLLA
jgi:ferredoxin